jgi:hypothetical protein
MQDEVVSPLNTSKYIVLNGNFVFDMRNFDLRDVFQECNPGIKREIPVQDILQNIQTNVLQHMHMRVLLTNMLSHM